MRTPLKTHIGLTGNALALTAAIMVLGTPHRATAQNRDWTNDFNGYWTNSADWVDGDIPDTDTEIARFITDFTANRIITLDTAITNNGLYFEDTGGGTDNIISINGSGTLYLRGTGPTIDSRSSGSGGNEGLQINSPLDIGNGGFTKIGGGSLKLNGGITGSGPITNSAGSINLSASNPNFTGEVVINAGYIDLRSSAGAAQALGSTNVGTIINGSGRIRFRDLDGALVTISEPITLNGFHSDGSIAGWASKSFIYDGPVTLNTNGSFSTGAWASTREPGTKDDFRLFSVISDGGAGHDVHFLHYINDAGTGTLSRTSEIILGGQSTYGGDTYISATRAADDLGPFSGNVRLTNGNDRLPTGTTLTLGGRFIGAGQDGAVGRLALNGYDQELAGLKAGGTGVSNHLVGGSSVLSTLTLNIAGGTNTYSGFLGGPQTDDNNLALTKQGAGTLELTAQNTYTGATLVQNGMLLVNGDHAAATGAMTIQNGGALGGTGIVGGAVTIALGGTLSPGNSPGTLTLNDDLDISAIGAGNAGNLIFELGTSSDLIFLTSGQLDVGNSNLGFADFTFSDSGGLALGDYTLFDTPQTILGMLDPADLNGTIGTFNAVLGFGDGGTDLVLSIIPEPTTWAILVLGAAIIVGLRAKRWRRG